MKTNQNNQQLTKVTNISQASQFFTEKTIPYSIKLPQILRSLYKLFIQSPYSKEREDKFNSEITNQIHLLENEKNLLTAEQIIQRCDNPLWGFPSEPLYKCLSEYLLANKRMASQKSIKFLSTKFGLVKMILYFRELKNEILIKENFVNEKAKFGKSNQILSWL